MTDEIELLTRTAQQIMRRPDHGDGATWDQEVWDRLAHSGLSLVSVPEAVGGSGGDLGDVLVVLREQGRAAARVPLAEAALGAGWLASLAGIDVGEGLATVVSGDGLTARRSASGVRVVGVAERVPYGRVCPVVLAVIDLDGQEVVVRLSDADFAVEEAANLAGEPRDTLRVDATLPEDGPRAVPSRTRDQLVLRMELARAAMIVGAAEEAVRLAVEHSQGRVQFGRPLSAFQAIQHELAAMTADAVSSWIAVQAAGMQLSDGGDDVSLAVTVAKAYCSEAAGRVARAAHQVHGAIGITAEHPLGRSTRCLWSWREELGNELECWAQIGSSIAAGRAERIWQVATEGA